uniref:ATP synthase subunit a n=1 Tax=Eusyllis blomstrandi TaxID=199554 RepID=A0A1C9UZB7_EUSBL|nr:ATP synthase F0 subunit 6 [Eusyllis blomstrandi]AOR87119.1 ATP synthase F0 subunit 6 [Eusyllis blomstrandi]
MMMDIFSSFDPFISSSMLFSTTFLWGVTIMILLMIFSSFWVSQSQTFWLLSSLKNIIVTQTSRTHSANMKGFMYFITPLFMFIIIMNLMGLIPYIFSTSSHLMLTLTLGLPLWLTLILSSFTYNFKTSTASLLPGGAPDWLNPFLVLVETLSTLVRPLTLSFRLAANMTAGHVVLGLMGSYMTSSFLLNLVSMSSVMVFMVGVGYIMFEIGICLIQAYIFCLLLTLYSDDHS